VSKTQRVPRYTQGTSLIYYTQPVCGVNPNVYTYVCPTTGESLYAGTESFTRSGEGAARNKVSGNENVGGHLSKVEH